MAVIVSWNVAGRVRSVAAQATALAEREADVVGLQEIRPTALAAWRHALGELGYAHVATSWDEHGAAGRPEPDRRLGVLVAARSPLAVAAVPAVPWPERLLAVTTELDGELVELHNLHVPLSARPGQVKVLTLEAAFAHLAAPSPTPRVLVGDLNTPQYESREGAVQTFARTRSGRLRPDRGERHDRAELALVVGLAAHGYEDAFRSLHGYLQRDRSWVYPNGRAGFRLDHVLVRGLRVEACEYEHDWRKRGLSDQAAIWARVRPR